MGVGVFYDDTALTVICSPYDDIEDYDDHDLYRMCYDDMLDTVLASLPSCFTNQYSHTSPTFGRAGVLLAQSGLHSVYVKECDSGNGNVYVSLTPRESIVNDFNAGYANTLNLAIANIHKSMNRIASKFGQTYDLRRRTTAWTTGEFWPFDPMTYDVRYF